LAGAAFSLVAAGTAASVTLFGDRVAIHVNTSESTSAQGTLSGQGAPPAISSNQQSYRSTQAGQLAAGNSAQGRDAGTTVQTAGPSIFEQQVRAQEPSQQISAGPTVFEQEVRSQAPRPKSVPGPITRGPGPVLH
jgi:hypothetical protein